ncbi:MAG: DNAase [Candidatus Muproteobacteria bacterium RBG_16_62_13]|uniref:DNAase n=1 Tax=Candidatus Muproteobacteria bacterium RBG_16_62_13 TaxID=1817756 RepID=A0A1F6SZ78_9PROT|nr:MAG: DNAase [Candidatus Muproteobacteria bacterium RBG_16_62_13]
MLPSLVDSHCHLNFEPLCQDIDRVLDNARKQGVDHLLCVSVNLESYPEVLALAEKYPHIYASVGVHPNEREGREPDVAELTRLAAHPRVVAIGETGLDFYRSEGDLEWQRQRFRNHIRAARQAGKPLIIHTREAADDTLRIMREEEAGSAGGVMHCFTETWEVARASLDMGFYVSFSGIVTFRSAEALREVARRVPDDRLLIETDAPYLAPIPFRGKTNEPAYVSHVASLVADLRKTDIQTLADLTTGNFFRLFKSAHAVAA